VHQGQGQTHACAGAPGVETRCVLGALGTGKTRALVERVARLLDGGADPRDLLVFAASPVAVDATHARLAERLGAERAADVRVCTPRAFALEVLGTPQGRAFTGREPRVLLSYEVNVLMEDMKTSGLRAGRLKEMLKFFYRSWTELADDDPNWLCTDEELQVHGLLKDCLAFSRGMLEPEVANFALNCLRADAQALEAARVPHVLVDDYQALGRASQLLAGMVARTSLTVAGDAFASAQVYESYPYAAGLDELLAAPGVAVERLEASSRPRAVVDAACALRARAYQALAQNEEERCEERLAAQARLENITIDQMRARLAASSESDTPRDPKPLALTDVRAAESAHAGAVESQVLATPQDELAAVVARVEAALAGGVAPERVYVATPNRTWTGSLAKAFAAHGVATAAAWDARPLNGDPRDLARCEAARVLALLQLAADPTSSVAWRSWCGFGDWLANSTGFAALRNVGLEAGADLYATLSSLSDAAERAGVDHAADMVPGDRLGADERASVERIVTAYRAGRALADQLAGLEGAALLERAACLVLGKDAPVPAALREIGGVPDAQALDAAGLLGLVYGLASGEDGFGQAAGSVRLGSVDQAAGLAFDLLVVCGFVNGFTPRHAYFDQVSTSPAKQRQMRVSEARRLYGALTGCCEAAVFTSFTQLDALQAERLDVKVDRIRMRDGKRVAAVSPSVMLADLGLQ